MKTIFKITLFLICLNAQSQYQFIENIDYNRSVISIGEKNPKNLVHNPNNNRFNRYEFTELISKELDKQNVSFIINGSEFKLRYIFIGSRRRNETFKYDIHVYEDSEKNQLIFYINQKKIQK